MHALPTTNFPDDFVISTGRKPAQVRNTAFSRKAVGQKELRSQAHSLPEKLFLNAKASPKQEPTTQCSSGFQGSFSSTQKLVGTAHCVRFRQKRANGVSEAPSC